MAVDTDEIRVGATGNVYVAPLGSTIPTDVTTSWPVAWTDLGAISEDGPSLTPGLETNPIKIWQALFAVRRIVTDRSMTWKFKLMQRNTDTFVLAFGGGSFSDEGAHMKYTPPEASFIDERMFGIEVRENDIVDRYILVKGIVSEVGDISFKRGEPTAYDLTIAALAQDEVDTWTMLTNDPAVVAGS